MSFLQDHIHQRIDKPHDRNTAPDGPGSAFPLVKWAVMALVLFSAGPDIRAQQSDNPSDATPALSYALLAANTTPLPSPCPTGALNPASSHFSLSGATSTPASIASQPMCGSFMEPPPNVAPGPANDVWFRLDPPATPTYFRFTLFAGGSPAMLFGGLALYEAPSAAGPFRLIECATGGSLTAGLATLETRSATTPGNKLYLRVWDRATRNSNVNFTLCVQGQDVATMAARGAGETACTATPLAASGSILSSNATNVDYVFAQEENGSLFSDSSYVGGDIWLSLTVPTSGVVRIAMARGSATGGTALTLGLSAYISPNCSDPTMFRQVGSYNGMPASNSQLPATITSGVHQLQVSCLTPGETLYLRIHSSQLAQANQKRYGRFRILWMAGPMPGAALPTNNQPCSATPLSFNASCPVAPAGGNNFNACNTPGIPLPGCGGFDGSSNDVWYSFVAPASGTIKLDATAGAGVPANPAMALYTTGGHGCNGRFTLIECDDRMGPGNSARIIRTGLVPGQTYYVRAWAEGASASGTFDICITEPIPPAGSCFYLMKVTSESNTGQLGMDVSINGGTPIVHTTTLGETNETFLIAIPTGANVFFQFQYYNTSWNMHRQVFRLGDPDPLWHTWSGGAVIGPAPTPQYNFTLNNACGPLSAPSSDCLGSRTICTELVSGSNTVFGYVREGNPPGNTYDLLAANMGCLDAENKGIEWLIFRPTIDGTVAFWFNDANNASLTDLDFAVWDAGLAPYAPTAPNISSAICAPNGPPIRCSSARRNFSTGLQPGLAGVTSEGTGGWGWLSPLPVLADHVYLVAVVKVSSANPEVRYQMRWTLYANTAGTATPSMLDCTPMVLPVEYLFIDARPIKREVEVTWATATEQNSSHFIVERSTDGRSFSPIGVVEAAGFSQSRTDYRFLDQAPVIGPNYYRLQQVDRDGALDLSEIVVAVLNATAEPLTLIPNPATDQAELFLTEGLHADRLVISDAVGRILYTRVLPQDGTGSTRQRIDVSSLAKGVYHVQLLDDAGRTVGSARLMKQ